MLPENTLSVVYTLSENIVAREIEGEIIIVPLIGGIGEDDEAIYTLNQTGQAIWEQIDGQRSLEKIADLLPRDDKTMKKRIADGLELSRRMSWEHVVQNFFMPSLGKVVLE